MQNAPDNQKKQLPPKAILMLAINVVATAILFFLTVNDSEPFIAPVSEVSMVLRWAVIAAVIGFLQLMWTRGWKAAGKKQQPFRTAEGDTENHHRKQCGNE